MLGIWPWQLLGFLDCVTSLSSLARLYSSFEPIHARLEDRLEGRDIEDAAQTN